MIKTLIQLIESFYIYNLLIKFDIEMNLQFGNQPIIHRPDHEVHYQLGLGEPAPNPTARTGDGPASIQALSNLNQAPYKALHVLLFG